MIFPSHEVVAAWFGVLINIATPGWNEYEEEVNCSPQNEADPKGEGEIQRGVCYYPDYSSCAIAVISSLGLR